MGTMIKLVVQDQAEPLEVYEAKPTGEIRGGLIVIEEVWGLAGHIKDVADRFAAEGYWVLSPELLSETRITEHASTLMLDVFDPKTRNEAQPRLRQIMTPIREPDFGAKTLARLHACFEYLYGQPDTKEWVAVTGFCFGGSYSFALALSETRLKAAVPFYGHADTEDLEALKKVTCPILAFYGEKDERLMATLPETEGAFKKAGVHFTAKVYPNCGHAFFNDTNPFTYNEKAAKDAWRRTIELLAAN
ncbi:MAG TPA: dienelactone hydrolase family protein [Verrucomicrobiae bacterium]|nr:dienelactone hydrolase family protein [Verrucomicrobiae bacterium]